MAATNTFAPRATALLDTLAIRYGVKGQEIPSRITIQQRYTFARGAGLPEFQSGVMAMQDRGSELANVLGSLIAQSGDSALIERAESLIADWNDECGAFFRGR